MTPFALALLGGCQHNQSDSLPAGVSRGAFGSLRETGFAARQASAAPEDERFDAELQLPARTVADAGASAARASAPTDAASNSTNFMLKPSAAISGGATVPPLDLASDKLAADESGAKIDLRQEERLLRSAYAEGSEPVGSSVRLAAWLADHERHEEALFVMDQTLTTIADTSLRLVRAGILRDLGRHDEAVRELQSVVRERVRHAVAPGTLLELAQVQLLAGQRDQARSTYADLLQVIGDGEWFAQHGEQLGELRSALDQPKGSFFTMRDLLALLRAAPSATARVQLIDRLLAPLPNADANLQDERAELRSRVLAIGCADESPAVRARTLRAASSLDLADTEFWATALADPAPLVRTVAADALLGPLAKQGTQLLLLQLANENDSAVFVALHRALERLVGPATDFHLAAAEQAGRDDARNYWQQRCSR